MRWPVLLATLALCAPGCSGPRVAVVEENDLFSRGSASDRDYTQGARVEVARDPKSLGALEAKLARGLAAFHPFAPPRPPDAGAWTLFLGQRIFTPGDIQTSAFQADDRPYAGILEVGAASTRVWLDPDPARRRDLWLRTTAKAGVIGPASLARETQIGYHNWIGEPRPNGWRHQLPNEGILGLGWLLRGRFAYGRRGNFEGDASWEGAGQLSNDVTSLGGGLLLRLGANLPRAEGLFGPGAEGDPPHSAWVFLRLTGRGVARDATLDGPLFGSGPSVDREAFRAEAELGGAMVWRHFSLAYTFVISTREFAGQPDPPTYGRLTAGFHSLW